MGLAARKLRMAATAAGGVEFTDNFNRADEALEVSASWDKVGTGQANIVSNAVDYASAIILYRTTADLSSDNQYAQMLVVTNDLGDINNSVIVRFSSSALTYYVFRRYLGNAQMFKVVSGSFTQIGSNVTDTRSAPYTQRLEVEGTTLRGIIDGVTVMTETDSGISTGRRVGFRTNYVSSTPRIDDFEAGTL